MAGDAQDSIDKLAAELRTRGVQSILELFDDTRVATAAIAAADAIEKLSRDERLIVLTFELLSTLGNVDERRRVDVVAMVTAMAQDSALGAALWLHVAREWGIGVTTARDRGKPV